MEKLYIEELSEDRYKMKNKTLHFIITYRDYMLNISNYLELKSISSKLKNIKLDDCNEEFFNNVYESIINKGEKFLIKNPNKLKGFKDLTKKLNA